MMRQVFARYDLQTRHLIRLWMRSWKARGWRPRIYFGNSVPADFREGKDTEAPCNLINYSWSPRRPCTVAWDFSSPPAQNHEADVVIFPQHATEAQILNCGRSLC